MRVYVIEKHGTRYAVTLETRKQLAVLSVEQVAATVNTLREARAAIYTHLALRLLSNEKRVSLIVRS